MVGSSVGPIEVGDTVGPCVGPEVVGGVGDTIGDSDGDRVGSLVGGVGDLVGSSEGAEVIGLALGWSVGPTDWNHTRSHIELLAKNAFCPHLNPLLTAPLLVWMQRRCAELF